MASYEVKWKRSATKELKKIPKSKIPPLLKAVESLSQNPFPSGVKKLIGSDITFRIRVGTYRIVYDLYNDELIIEIIRVRHRKDVYE